MSGENLTHYTPDTSQYYKFNEICEMDYDKWCLECAGVDVCSICRMAIHQYLLSIEKHTCVYGMTKEQFEAAMDNADCDF